jgi:AraC family L-rhamnose operon transcriptional activator RhaR
MLEPTPAASPTLRLPNPLGIRQYPRAMVFALDTDCLVSPAIAASRHILDGNHEPHSHDFFEIAVVAGGQGRHTCQAGERELRAGDVVVIHLGAWHAYLDCHKLLVYNCLFGPELLDADLLCCKEDPRLDGLLGNDALAAGVTAIHISQASLRASVRHLETLMRLCQAGPAALRLEIMANLLLFLSQLARACPAPTARPGRPTEPHPAVLSAIQILNEDLARNWTLSDLAYTLHIDRSYLVRLFRAHTGLPPMAYLHERRLERAAQALIHTRASITTISRTVGWRDPNVFARRFRARFGMSASQYRASGNPATRVARPAHPA